MKYRGEWRKEGVEKGQCKWDGRREDVMAEKLTRVKESEREKNEIKSKNHFE